MTKARQSVPRRAAVILAAVVVATSLLGCVAAAQQPRRPKDVAPLTVTRSLPLRRVPVAEHYGSPLRAVITDSVTLRRVWELTRETGTPPQVDFTREMVILVALGAQPTTGWGIHVDSVVTTPAEQATAFVTIGVPEGCVVGPAFTLPMDVVVVQRPGRQNVLVAFAEHVHHIECAPFHYDAQDQARFRHLLDSLKQRSSSPSHPE